MAKNDFGYVAKIGGDTSGLELALQDAQKELQSAEQGIKALDRAIAQAAANGSDTSELLGAREKAYARYAQTVSTYMNEISGLSGEAEKAFNEGRLEAGEYASYIAQLSEATEKYNQAQRELSGNAAEQTSAYDNYKNNLKEANSELGENKNKLTEINQSIKGANSAHLDFNDTLELNKQKQAALKEITAQLKDKLNELKSEAADMKEALKLGNITQDQYDEFRRTLINTQTELANVKNKTGEYGAEAEKAKDSTGTFGDMLKANLTSSAIIKGVEALAAKIKEIVDDINQMIEVSMEAGDTVDKQSQILGLSRTAYQEWDYILNLNGASISNMTTATRTLTNAVEKAENGTESAASAFGKLGISVSELQGMTREELFENVIFGLQGITNEQERNEIANDLLGRSYTQLIPLLNQSAESTKELKNAAHENGMIMTDEAVDAAVKYKDSLTTLTYTLNGLKNNLMGEIMPGLALITEGISDIAAENEEGAEKIKAGFTETANAVFTVISEVMENVEQVVEIAVEGIPEIISANSGNLLNSGQKVLEDILNGLSEHMNDVVNAGVDILKFILKGIADAIVTLGEKFGEIVTAIIGALIDAIPDVCEFAIVLCDQIADGLVHYDWVGMARNMVNNLVNGLESAWAKVQVWIDNTFNGGKLYGGDVNNVSFGNLDFWNEWKANTEDGLEILAEAQDDFQAAYGKGKEILKDDYNIDLSGGNDDKTIEEECEEAAKSIDDAAENITASTYHFNEIVTSDSKKRDKAIKDSVKSTMENLKRIQKEQGLDDKWLEQQYLNLANSLEKGTDAYLAAYDAYLDIKEKNQKAEKSAAEAEIKQIKEEGEARGKAVKEAAEAENKQREEAIEEHKKAVENAAKEYEKSGMDMAEKVTSNGKERLVLSDWGDETKKLDKLTASKEKLKALGVSDALLESVGQYDYKDGTQQMYLDELLRMRPEQLKRYDADYQEYQSTLARTAENDVGELVVETTGELQENVTAMYDEFIEISKEKGEAAGLSYLEGFAGAMGGVDVSTFANMLGLGGTASGNKTADTADGSVTVNGGNTAGNAGSGISPQTVLSINVAGTEVIRGTLAEFFMDNILSGGGLNV
ncbi:MAG: hypothetical protein NC078_09910 [Ruminococcus sp.]|nr:hypothetical protein [Ruminococcus sp.]